MSTSEEIRLDKKNRVASRPSSSRPGRRGPGCGCYTLVPRDSSGNTNTYFGPAEALRAEHRSPQSGQEEGH